MQQAFAFRTWGGKRAGAGRPPKGARAGAPHRARERFSKPTPVHVTLKVVAPIWDVDYYSSGPTFEGWAELDDSPFLYRAPDYPRLSVARPQTWLLRVGWRKAGPIRMRDVPGPRSSSPSPSSSPN